MENPTIVPIGTSILVVATAELAESVLTDLQVEDPEPEKKAE